MRIRWFLLLINGSSDYVKFYFVNSLKQTQIKGKIQEPKNIHELEFNCWPTSIPLLTVIPFKIFSITASTLKMLHSR